MKWTTFVLNSLVILLLFSPSILSQEPSFSGPQTKEGTMAPEDVEINGHYVDTYSVRLQTSGRLTVRLMSGNFSPVLIVTSPSGESPSTDTCDGGLLDCREIDKAEAGVWEFQVTSAKPKSTGKYSLIFMHPQASRLSSVETKLPKSKVFKTLPPPEDPGAYSVELEGNVTLNSSLERYPLHEGKSLPAGRLPLKLLEGDIVTVNFQSRDFEPLVAIASNSEVISFGDIRNNSSILSFPVPKNGLYTLYYGSPDVDAKGEAFFSMNFKRNRERIANAPKIKGKRDKDPNGWPWNDGSAFEAIFESAPEFSSIRGAEVNREGESITYQSDIVMPSALNTTVECDNGRCSAVSLFATVDARSAVDFMSLLAKRINAVLPLNNYKLNTDKIPDRPSLTVWRWKPESGSGVEAIVYSDLRDYDPDFGVRVYMLVIPGS